MTQPSIHRGFIRRGVTLIELMVVIALMGMLAMVGLPSLNALLGIEQQAAVKEMAQTLVWLREEAMLRNVAFRVEMNLDRRTWNIKVGEPDTLIFATAEEAEEFRTEQKRQMRRFSKRDIEAGIAPIDEDPDNFSSLDDPRIDSTKELAEGLAFEFVYTPQYEKSGLRPHLEPPEDPEEDRIAYVHIFPDGTAEHAVIRIIEEDDEDAGMTLELEPMGGQVLLTEEIKDPSESLSWVPDEGPDFR